MTVCWSHVASRQHLRSVDTRKLVFWRTRTVLGTMDFAVSVQSSGTLCQQISEFLSLTAAMVTKHLTTLVVFLPILCI